MDLFIMRCFCSTNLRLASTRWVLSTFSSHWPLSTNQHHWLTSATSINVFLWNFFGNAWNQTQGSCVRKQVMLTFVLCCPSIQGQCLLLPQEAWGSVIFWLALSLPLSLPPCPSQARSKTSEVWQLPVLQANKIILTHKIFGHFCNIHFLWHSFVCQIIAGH